MEKIMGVPAASLNLCPVDAQEADNGIHNV